MVKIVSKIITIIMNLQYWMKLGGGQLSMPGSMIIYKFEENVTSRAQIVDAAATAPSTTWM